jgi:copper/silver efflux system protein
MLNRLIEWSVRNRLLVLLATAFLVGAGIWAVRTTPVDAIPDLSDVQVIVQTEWAEQAPQIIEDQVTYPLTTALLAVPGATTVRGISGFGISYVYVLFEDGTDPYWARSRVLEYLSQVGEQLPAGRHAAARPDATGVGWVYQYTLESDRHDLASCAACRTSSSATSSRACPAWRGRHGRRVRASSTRWTSTRSGCTATASPSSR